MAKGITKDERKTALLLHTGGLNLQDLYYTLLTSTAIKPFAESMKLLDNYFARQLNVPFERHQFRQMEQASGESVYQFVCRLRQKAISCEFENVFFYYLICLFISYKTTITQCILTITLIILK